MVTRRRYRMICMAHDCPHVAEGADHRSPECPTHGKSAMRFLDDPISAAEILALPHEALPGLHTDDSDDEPGACWLAVRQMAAGRSAVRLLLGDVIWATSSRWTGRRRVIEAVR